MVILIKIEYSIQLWLLADMLWNSALKLIGSVKVKELFFFLYNILRLLFDVLLFKIEMKAISSYCFIYSFIVLLPWRSFSIMYSSQVCKYTK